MSGKSTPRCERPEDEKGPADKEAEIREAVLKTIREEAKVRIDTVLASIWADGSSMLFTSSEQVEEQNNAMAAELESLKQRQDWLEKENSNLRTMVQGLTQCLLSVESLKVPPKIPAQSPNSIDPDIPTSPPPGLEGMASPGPKPLFPWASLTPGPSDFFTPAGTPVPRTLGLDPYLSMTSPDFRASGKTGSFTASPNSCGFSGGYPTTPEVRKKDLSSMLASPCPQTPPPTSYPTTPHDYSFIIRKADGVPLGLDLTPTKTKNKDGLRIDGIHAGGAIEAWNKQCPSPEEVPSSRAIVPGDVLVQVNQAYGNKDEMLNECKSHHLLWLAFLRGDQNAAEARRSPGGAEYPNKVPPSPQRSQSGMDAAGSWKAAGFKSPKPTGRPNNSYGTPRTKAEASTLGSPVAVQSPKLGG